MKEKSESFGIKLYLIGVSYFFMMLTLLNSFYWQKEPAILSSETANLKLALANIIHGATLTGINVLLLLFGYLLARHKKLGGAQLWSYLFIFGWVIVLSLYFIKDSIEISVLYNAFFPMLRNAYPLITGIILGWLTVEPFQKLFERSKISYYAFIVIAIVVPSIFDKDIFYYDSGATISYAWVLFILGATLTTNVTKKRAWCEFTILGILAILALGLMPSISQASHGSLTTAYRLTSAANAVIILPSLALVRLLVSNPKLAKMKIKTQFLLSFLGVIMVASFPTISEALNELNDKSAWGTRYLEVFQAVSLPGIIFFVTYLLYLLPVFKHAKALDVKFIPRKLLKIHPKQLVLSLKKWGTNHKVTLLVGGTLLFLSYLSFVATNVDWRVANTIEGNKSYNAFIYCILQRPQLIVVNALLLACLYWILRALTNNFWFSFLTSDFLILIWVIATHLKIASRNEPILPSEVVMVGAYTNLLSMVPHWILIVAVIVLVVLVGLIIWLNLKKPIAKLSWKRRLFYLVIPCVVVGSSFYWNHDAFPLKKPMQTLGNDPAFYNQLYAAQLNGPTLQFMNNLDVVIMKEPSNYSKAKVEEIVAKYTALAKEINQTRTNNLSEQTIIFNLSESFSDPNHVTGTKLKSDPIPYINSLMKKTTSGYMISPGYGGGTANIEYMTLTGFSLGNFSPTLSIPYTQLVSSSTYSPSIANYFPSSVAIHPYVGTFYSRTEVYKKFGFDDFIYDGSKTPLKHKEKIQNSPYYSDRTAYANTLDVINSNKKSGQFINLVTMQNHMPYDQDTYASNAKISVKKAVGLDDYVTKMINNFTIGINYTDKYVAEFIAKIDKINKPITIVFYGDHLPGIYSNDMNKDSLNLHETDYFIYSNKYARKHGATNKLTNSSYVSPSEFPAMVAEQTNSKVSPYYALLTKIYQTTPAEFLGGESSSSTERKVDYVNSEGKLISSKQLTKEQKEVLEDLKIIQYDITAGKHYVKNTNFMKMLQ